MGSRRPRQVVKFSFYRVDPSWRRLSPSERESVKQELCRSVESFADRMVVRSYSLVGMRGDADFLLWQVCDRLEDIQALAASISGSAMGPYLSVPYSYLAMTRRSTYVSAERSAAEAGRLAVTPGDSRYLFVYPFVKTREWYGLSQEVRQRMMDEHIAVGRQYPSVKLNTTYSFGLDDQEFVVAFETDEPGDFQDLVMRLRETEASRYTLRDTPIFTCVAMGLRETLDSLAGAAGARRAGAAPERDDGWARVADAAEVPPGAAKVVYFQGEQVAVFNVDGRLYAVGNQCSHASGPLAEGRVDGTAVTCPWHGSQFDLSTGEPRRPPAGKAVPVYRVKAVGEGVFLAPAPVETPVET